VTLAMTEDDLLTAITEAATFLGWRWHHIRRSDKAIQQGNAGFPDLVMARRGIVIFAELKSARGRLDAEQFAWMHALGWSEDFPNATNLDRVRLRVWWPEDLDRALKELA
jgi:hypothetical protein